MRFKTKLPSCPCVYEIRNSLTGRHYIGSSLNPAQRRRRHFLDLRLDRHRSRFMQRDFNKCGADAFEFVVLEATTAEAMLEREQYWIDSTTPPYNSARIAGNCRGVKHTPEVVAANRARGQGFGNGNAKVTPEMADAIAALRDSHTTSQLAQIVGVHASTIERVLKRIGSTKGGKRHVSTDVRKQLRAHALSVLLPSRRVKVEMLNDCGVAVREFESLTAAATAAGVSVSTLHGAIAHGYKCAGNRYRKRDAAMLIFGLKT